MTTVLWSGKCHKSWYNHTQASYQAAYHSQCFWSSGCLFVRLVRDILHINYNNLWGYCIIVRIRICIHNNTYFCKYIPYILSNRLLRLVCFIVSSNPYLAIDMLYAIHFMYVVICTYTYIMSYVLSTIT